MEGDPAEAGCALGEARPMGSVPEAGVVLWEGPAADGGGPNVMVGGMAVREQVPIFLRKENAALHGQRRAYRFDHASVRATLSRIYSASLGLGPSDLPLSPAVESQVAGIHCWIVTALPVSKLLYHGRRSYSPIHASIQVAGGRATA